MTASCRLVAVASALLAGSLGQGCRGRPPRDPVRFARNEAVTSDELVLDPGGRASLDRALTEHFGTMEEPRFAVLESWRSEGFDPNHWTSGKAGEPSLAQSAALFRAHCSRCHGPTGAGDGRMAARLRTRPRDYRRGVFKKTPLDDKARPRHADLVRTLEEGVPGTAMPAWGGNLSPAEIAGLASYVRLLAIRGETERLSIFDHDPDDGFDANGLRENYDLVVNRWRRGGEKLILPSSDAPAATPERVAHGRDLFHGELGVSCVRCHGAAGHGNGPSAQVVDPDTGELAPFRDEWNQPIRPRDLVCAPLRFGDRPIDIYYRIHAGINGTPMPAHGGILSEEDIWDLVFYVDSLREPEADLDPGQTLRVR